MISTSTIFFLLCTSLVCSCLQYCGARDTITTTGGLISDNGGETLVLAGGKFELGFFAPYGSNYNGRYIGIWYYMDRQTVVWVANRDKPLPNFTGVFGLSPADGNLVVLDGNGASYFSTSIPVSSESQPSLRKAKLLDTGNLVVMDDQSGRILWQSFENPTDTFLPGMKMDKLELTSWKSRDDPASGNFKFAQDQGQYIISNRTIHYWKSGGSGSFTPNQMLDAAAFLLSDFEVNLTTRKHSYSQLKFPRNPDLNNTRLQMNSSGKIQYSMWDEQKKGWIFLWSEPKDNCSVYNPCGKFGICNITDSNELNCQCLTWFKPTLLDKWKSKDFSSGCTRKSDICSSNKEGDIFLNMKVMKLENPDEPFFPADSEQVCTKECLDNCQCQAYSYVMIREYAQRGRHDGRQGCWFWTSDLIDLQEGNGVGSHNLSVRVASSHTGLDNPEQSEGSQLEKTSFRLNPMVLFTIVILVVALLCSISYITYRRMVTRRQEIILGNPVLHLYDSERRRKDLIDQGQFTEHDKKGTSVPFFDLESILAATDNFSHANKLGQGGFGPVYKGKFPGGQEIAVKRLSSHSGQGLEEFKNEVVLIAKLQHRNLVRLLGYCIKGDEKILLYEYMPNKSLDAFIFDRTLCMLLDWAKRFDIILGIARGLLYLHQDSRLRVIHRDLKASNILLDEEMNPKISDFGLARIVGGRETEANTNRVVGTYGYMSPEYALDGLFSIKSDVFSFGVVVLEIISGKRNTGFYQSQQALNLLGHAWSLWKEENALALVDQTLVESCDSGEVFKCIIVGLLCVQEDPDDRPTMSNVVFMLGSETASIPNPKQPAFVARKRLPSTPSSSSSKPEIQSNNELTFSVEEGR